LDSNAHNAIKELPELKRIRFYAWQAMEHAMEGDDRKEHFQTLVETALKSLHQDSSMSVLQLADIYVISLLFTKQLIKK
jgi:hypothetical protein